jgi:hypothetical protein
VPPRRLELLAGRLPVACDECRALLEALGIGRGDRLGDRGVQGATALLELRAVGNLLGERVLEEIDRLRSDLLQVDKLA